MWKIAPAVAISCQRQEAPTFVTATCWGMPGIIPCSVQELLFLCFRASGFLPQVSGLSGPAMCPSLAVVMPAMHCKGKYRWGEIVSETITSFPLEDERSGEMKLARSVQEGRGELCHEGWGGSSFHARSGLGTAKLRLTAASGWHCTQGALPVQGLPSTSQMCFLRSLQGRKRESESSLNPPDSLFLCCQSVECKRSVCLPPLLEISAEAVRPRQAGQLQNNPAFWTRVCRG